MDLMVVPSEPDNAAATPESPIREGSPPPPPPPQPLQLLTLPPPTQPTLSSCLLKSMPWRCGRLAVHLGRDLLLHLLPDFDEGKPPRGKLHPPGGTGVAAVWRPSRVSGGATQQLLRRLPMPPPSRCCCVVAAVSPIAPAATQLGEAETCENATVFPST